MNRLSRLFAASLALLTLGACATDQIATKQGMGTLIGAGTGALIGSQIGDGRGQLVATSIGTLVGAYVGNQAGQSLDRADALHASRAHHKSLEYTPAGTTTAWVNPDTGHTGSVTPTRTYTSSSGDYCREFQHKVQIGGETEHMYGTACREPDGSWQVVN